MSAETIGEHVASDGHRLIFRRWEAFGEPRGTVVALHGVQSHSGWYGWSSVKLASAGWNVRFLERRGCGMDPADRGHARGADRLVNDVVQFLRRAAHECAARSRDPTILLGVSWGGRLAACVAARYPELVDALALVAPGICARVRPSWRQRKLLALAVAAGKVRRTAPIPLGDPALFTADPRWQAFIRDDPLALREATVGFFAASAALEAEAKEAAERIACPTLLMLAGRDRIIDNAATRQWFARLAALDRTLVEFPAATHTLEFDACRERFVAQLVGWLGGCRVAH